MEYSNTVMVLIQIVHDRGEINNSTYEKIMQKLKKGADRNENTNHAEAI